MPRTITATVAGHTYYIPAMWLVGATRHLSYLQAVQHWHQQAQMELAATAGVVEDR